MFYLSAFLVGFLGSFHCASMCGPIALALPSGQGSKLSMVMGRLLYNSGRIVTYSMLGLLVGLIGHRIAIAGFQKMLSVTSGVLILVIALVTLLYPRISATNRINSALSVYTTRIKSIFKNLFGKKSRTTLFLIGAVNGLLPCGFVYLALAAAVSSGNFLNSAGYMMLFGSGTLPMVFSFSFARNIFGIRFYKYFRKVTPYVAMIVAMLLIYRGMSFTNHSCCHH
jgi:sulfite exporter TauE/SafE